jgi:hypothetical protein
MEKVIRDGFVAVLYSSGYGAGWYTWHGIPELIYDPVVVSMVESRASEDAIVAYCEEKYGDDGYYGGSEDLVIAWIVEGEQFVIEEYDGAESIKFKTDFEWMTD